jgi:hypothetical protein
MKTMTAFTELSPGFAYLAAILVYDLILLLRGELKLIDIDHFYETSIQESVQVYYGMLSQPEAGLGENSLEMDGFAGGGETGWDLPLYWDFPDFS